MGYKGKTTPADLQREVQNNKVQAMKARNEAYELRKENKQLRTALEKIAYTNQFERLCDVEAFAVKVLEGEK